MCVVVWIPNRTALAAICDTGSYNNYWNHPLWVIPVISIVTDAAYGGERGSVGAPDHHACDSQFVPPPDDVRVSSTGADRRVANDCGEVFVLLEFCIAGLTVASLDL